MAATGRVQLPLPQTPHLSPACAAPPLLQPTQACGNAPLLLLGRGSPGTPLTSGSSRACKKGGDDLEQQDSAQLHGPNFATLAVANAAAEQPSRGEVPVEIWSLAPGPTPAVAHPVKTDARNLGPILSGEAGGNTRKGKFITISLFPFHSHCVT